MGKRYRMNMFTGNMDIVTDTSISPVPVVSSGIVANGLLYAMPAGRLLEMIEFMNTTAVAVDILIGTTVAGSELSVVPITIPANGTNVWFNPYTNPTHATYNIYISSLAWGGASLTSTIYTE